MEETQAYAELNKRWKAACRIVLGGEVGELREFEGWLDSANEPMEHLPSSISGKEISFGECEYAAGSKRIGFSEIDFGKKFAPVSINEMKDLDSIVAAVAERAYYCGNIILGNSKFVERSSNVTDSFYIYNSSFVSDSKYAAYCSYLRYAEDVFGTTNDVYSKILIRGLDTHKTPRSLELCGTYMCPDAYFSSRCMDCHDCMFSFNLKAKSYCVGNFALERDKYLGIKQKLLEEMRQELHAHKKLPSLIEIVANSKSYATENRKILAQMANEAAEKDEKTDMAPVEKAFEKASAIVLGKSLGGMQKYENWLLGHVKSIKTAKSAASGRRVSVGMFMPYCNYPQERMLRIAEGWKAGESLSLSAQDAEEISFGGVGDSIGKIAYFVPEARLRENANLIDTALAYNSQNCYKGGIYSQAKYCGCSFWPRESEHMFGCDTAFSSSFCLHTYFSNNITRSFEVDASRNCSGSYFLHNCENVQDSMFCFNVKNLRNAIGNSALPAEKFTTIKNALVGQMHAELEKKKELKTGIYNIGAGQV